MILFRLNRNQTTSYSRSSSYAQVVQFIFEVLPPMEPCMVFPARWVSQSWPAPTCTTGTSDQMHSNTAYVPLSERPRAPRQRHFCVQHSCLKNWTQKPWAKREHFRLCAERERDPCWVLCMHCAYTDNARVHAWKLDKTAPCFVSERTEACVR